MKKSIPLLLFFAFGLAACHFGWETKARYFTGDYETVAAIAQGKGKPLWMILGGGENCRSCNQLIENMKREDIFRKFEDDYLFYRCNVDEPDNLFLKRLSRVIYDVGDAQSFAQIARVVYVFPVIVLLVESERDSGHFIPCILKQQCGDRAVRSSAHSEQCLFVVHWKPF